MGATQAEKSIIYEFAENVGAIVENTGRQSSYGRCRDSFVFYKRKSKLLLFTGKGDRIMEVVLDHQSEASEFGPASQTRLLINGYNCKDSSLLDALEGHYGALGPSGHGFHTYKGPSKWTWLL